MVVVVVGVVVMVKVMWPMNMWDVGGGGGVDEGVVDDDHVVVVVVKVMKVMLQGLDIITVSQPCSVAKKWHRVTTGYFCLQL